MYVGISIWGCRLSVNSIRQKFMGYEVDVIDLEV